MINKSKYLNEELTRIKTLFNFKVDDNSHDVLSEEVIRKSVISEQGVKKYPIDPIDFSKSLKDNMIGIYVDDTVLQQSLGEWDDRIKQEEDKRRKLESITIDVSAGATEVAATNRLPKGVSGPDHDYGGIVPKDKWTTHNQNKLSQEAPVGKIPVDYDPNSGYYRIKDGNKFLVINRVKKLSEKLKKYFAEHHPDIKPIFNPRYLTRADKPFATTKITGVTYKKEVPETKIPYIQRLLNMPSGMHQSKYHFVNKSGNYKNITKVWYNQIKSFMYKTPEEGGYTKNDPLFGVRELVDVGWEDWKKWKRNPELYPQFKKIKKINPILRSKLGF